MHREHAVAVTLIGLALGCTSGSEASEAPSVEAPARDQARAERPRAEPPRGEDEFLAEAMPPPDAPPDEPTAGEGPWYYTVYYGTNRRPVSAADPSKGYRVERDESGALHRGRCQVLINKGHEFGSLGERSWLGRWWYGDDRVLLQGIAGLAADAFAAEIQDILMTLQPGQADVVVYIHGYNNSFEEAAVRAAQIGFDLKVPGAMAFFSWPSLGSNSFAAYKTDEASVAASTEAIVEFLRELVVDAGAGRVHLIVHSMGNQGLAAAIAGLEARTDVHFGQVILAAPDLSPVRFSEVAAAYQRLAARTTLYVSSQDLALTVSGWLADGPRIGYSPPVAVVPGIDTVEVSDIDLTMLGHTYYAEAAPVLYDIAELLRSGQGPAQRLRVRAGGVGYWRISR